MYDTAEVNLSSCTVHNNKALENGGGAVIDDNSILLLDNQSTVIADNVASRHGGGVLALGRGFGKDFLLVATYNNSARYDADVSVNSTSLALLGESSLDAFVSRPGAGEGILPVRLHVSGYYGLPCEGMAVTAALAGKYSLGVSTSDKVRDG